MERGRSILTDTAAGTGAKAAPIAGRGTGNVPFAPGMASGNFGPQGSPQQGSPARVAAPRPPQQPQQEPTPQAAMPPGGAMGGMPPTHPFLDPMFYFEVMDTLMQALTSAAEKPNIWGY